MSEKQVKQEEVFYRKPRAKNYTGRHSCAGSHITYNVALSVKDGVQIAERGEKVDWFGYIQASEKACDLHNIVARYLNGDQSVVNIGTPLSGDIAAMPTNVNEIQALADRAKKGYEALTPEIKGIFNNSFEDFYNAVLTNQVETKISAYAAAKVEAAKKAVQEQQESEGK